MGARGVVSSFFSETRGFGQAFAIAPGAAGVLLFMYLMGSG